MNKMRMNENRRRVFSSSLKRSLQNTFPISLLLLLVAISCQQETKYEAFSYMVYAGDKDQLLVAEQARESGKQIHRSNSRIVKSLSDPTTYHVYNTDAEGKGWMYVMENGQLAVKAEVLNEENTGNYYSYYPNGRIRSFGQYEAGEKAGIWSQFHHDGTQVSYGSYENGDKTGTWYHYDTLRQYRDVRQYEGPNSFQLKMYDSQDRLATEGNIVKGKEHGRWLEYDSLGRIQYDINYLDGVLHDTTKIYKDGEPIVYLVYQNGGLAEEIRLSNPTNKQPEH